MPLTLSTAQVLDFMRAAGITEAQQSAAGPALQGGVVMQDCTCATRAPSALQPARPADEGAVKVCLFFRHLQPCATRHVKCGPNVTAGGQVQTTMYFLQTAVRAVWWCSLSDSRTAEREVHKKGLMLLRRACGLS